MITNPEVSVIMPVYNSQRYLAESIDSILAQTFTDFELIIINDCSSDDSASIIKHYAKLDNRVIVVNNSANLGLSGARNEALKIARGKYLAFQDSDDLSCLDRLTKQFNFLESRPDYFLVGSRVRVFGAGSSKIIGKIGSNNYLKSLLFFLNPFTTSSVMVRNFNLNKNSDDLILFDLNCTPAEDYDLWLTLFESGKFHNLSEPLALYRMHDQQTSHSRPMQQKISSAIIYSQQKFFDKTGLSSSLDELTLNSSIASNNYNNLPQSHQRLMSAWLLKVDDFLKIKNFNFFKADAKDLPRVLGHIWYIYLSATHSYKHCLFDKLSANHYLSISDKLKLFIKFLLGLFKKSD